MNGPPGSAVKIKIAYGKDGNCMLCHPDSPTVEVITAIYTTPGNVAFQEPVGSVPCAGFGKPFCIRDQLGAVVPAQSLVAERYILIKATSKRVPSNYRNGAFAATSTQDCQEK